MSVASLNLGSSNRIAAECPNCRKKWLVAEKIAGRRAKCGKCQNVMIIPHAVQESDIRAKKLARPVSEEYLAGMSRARTGMLLIAWSVVINCLVVFLVVIAALNGSSAVGILFAKYSWIANLVTLLTLGLGFFLCRRAPEETDSGKLSGITAVVFLLSLTFLAAFYFLSYSQIGSIKLLIAVQVLSAVLGFVLWPLHVLYLRKIASHLDLPSLTTSCTTTFWGFLGSGCSIAFVILISLVYGPNLILNTFGIVTAFAILVVFGLMVYALFALASAIRKEQVNVQTAQ